MTTDISKFTAAFGTDIFAMAGTQGTGLFIVVAVTDRGRVGFRDYSGNGDYRVRVEPLNDDAAAQLRPFFAQAQAGLPKPGAPKRFSWKVPGNGGQNRFSTTCNAEQLPQVLEIALAALVGGTTNGIVSAKDVCPEWTKELFAKCTAAGAGQELRSGLIKRVRELKLPGCNACSRWSTATLQSKVAAADAS